ncbi:MAG TPA: hypothetical protein VGO00_10665, partial [Kofleriaceae bacterium]|nr:hypothetical protein [Kofleriaceae bacterium]
MVRWIAGLVISVASCSRSVPPPEQPVVPPKPTPDAAVDAPAVAIVDASPPIDACSDNKIVSDRADYPVPTSAELESEPPSSGWFFDGRAWQHVIAACDLRDRVVMLDDHTGGPAGGSMWIWNRRDGS